MGWVEPAQRDVLVRKKEDSRRNASKIYLPDKAPFCLSILECTKNVSETIGNKIIVTVGHIC